MAEEISNDVGPDADYIKATDGWFHLLFCCQGLINQGVRIFSSCNKNMFEPQFQLVIIRNSLENSWVTLPPSLGYVQSTVTLLSTTIPRKRLWVMACFLLWRWLGDGGRTARQWLRASERYGRMLCNTVDVYHIDILCMCVL